MVVPYNPALLLKCNCHINVEAVSTVKVVKYLYKYILKGGTRAAIELRAQGEPRQPQPRMDIERNVDHGDEIQHHIDVRYANTTVLLHCLTACELYQRYSTASKCFCCLITHVLESIILHEIHMYASAST